MPTFRAEIPEVHTRITRLVVKQIIDDVLVRFKDIPFREFRYSGDSEALLTPGSALDTDIFNRSLVDNYVDVEVEDVPDENYRASFAPNPNTQHYIYSCKRTGVDIFPYYQNRKVSINFKLVCSSRVRLNGLVTRVTEGIHQSEHLFTHVISYDYDVPVSVAKLMNMVWHFMTNKHAYPNLTFEDWFNECKAPGLEPAYRQDGKNGGLIYKQNAVNVTSTMTGPNEEPRKNKNDEDGIWSVDFTIDTHYERPTGLRLSYPPVIHNQLLPDIWFNKPKTSDYTNRAATSSLATMAMERFKWNIGYGVPGRGDTGVKEPYFDDWGVESSDKKMMNLLTCLVGVDELNLRSFFHPFNDVSDYKFPEEFQRLIRVYPRALLYSGKHFIHLKAYKWNDTIRAEHLSFTDDFNIVTDFDLNPRNYYHLIFQLNLDPTNIASEVWEEARCEPEGLITYFSLFGDKYGDKLRSLWELLKESTGDDEVCLSREAINDVITDLIKDSDDDAFDNGRLFWDPYAARTKLNYWVVGD